jgi:methylenetetrahydrofolate--tRNA-(uracil-5-)-methyltransferase
MRPVRNTAVHQTGDLAELVCSNSFKSALLTNASGVLKEEMRRLGSLILPIADKHRVPAGEALAVDREPFASEVTATLEAHPNITIIREEVQAVPADRPLVVATGPLTSDALAESLKAYTGEALHFYDAVAPTVTLDSIDMDKVFRASRRGRSMDKKEASEPQSVGASGSNLQGESPEAGDNRQSAIDNSVPVEPASNDDYINCPLNKEEYFALYEALLSAELSIPHNPGDKDVPYFEMCLPIEEIARRGPRTMAFGPLKPVGLDDPRTGRWPYAVVQLRQENKDGTLWGLVGFQSRLKWGEQKRVFRLIPGLENAEFVRYGVMHRNTYVCAPELLDLTCQLRAHPGVFLAGQLTGVEGYLESAAIGIVAGINAARVAKEQEVVALPRETVLGSLCHYLVETEPKRFAPMNSNWGIVPELADHPTRDKREKARLKGERALAAVDGFIQRLD